eukprot:768373-Hanusia_phi.AAC.17
MSKRPFIYLACSVVRAPPQLGLGLLPRDVEGADALEVGKVAEVLQGETQGPPAGEGEGPAGHDLLGQADVHQLPVGHPHLLQVVRGQLQLPELADVGPQVPDGVDGEAEHVREHRQPHLPPPHPLRRVGLQPLQLLRGQPQVPEVGPGELGAPRDLLPAKHRRGPRPAVDHHGLVGRQGDGHGVPGLVGHARGDWGYAPTPRAGVYTVAGPMVGCTAWVYGPAGEGLARTRQLKPPYHTRDEEAPLLRPVAGRRGDAGGGPGGRGHAHSLHPQHREHDQDQVERHAHQPALRGVGAAQQLLRQAQVRGHHDPHRQPGVHRAALQLGQAGADRLAELVQVPARLPAGGQDAAGAHPRGRLLRGGHRDPEHRRQRHHRPGGEQVPEPGAHVRGAVLQVHLPEVPLPRADLPAGQLPGRAPLLRERQGGDHRGQVRGGRGGGVEEAVAHGEEVHRVVGTSSSRYIE